MVADVIIEDKVLWDHFIKRFKAANIGLKQLVREMNEDGIVMDEKRLSRFIRIGLEKKVPQKAYLWLLFRHGIEINLTVKGYKFHDHQGRERAKEFSQTI